MKIGQFISICCGILCITDGHGSLKLCNVDDNIIEPQFLKAKRWLVLVYIICQYQEFYIALGFLDEYRY